LKEPLVCAANLEPDNGFFLLWGFAEPAESDLTAAVFRSQLHELFSEPGRSYLFRSRYGRWLARLNTAFRRDWQGANLYFPKLPGEDVCAYFDQNRDRISEQRRRYAVPLLRYRQMVQAKDLDDFTPLGWEFPARSFSLAAYTARLFAASRALAALDGDWQGAGDDLLVALEAGLKLIGSGRTLSINSLGKTMVELSLRTLVSLLNRDDCPPDVVRNILGRLPERPATAFGTAAARTFAWMSFAHALERIERDKVVDPYMLKDYFREPAGFFALERFVAISGPRFFGIVHAMAAFFLKKNETTAALRAFWHEVGRLEEMPPASWPSGPRPVTRLGALLRLGPFWWLRNPMGKMMVRSAVPFSWPVLQHYVYRSHGLRARYDLVRLLARARIQTGPTMALSKEGLAELLATAAGRDPFSNKSYLFNAASGMLYSVGQDGQDNGGRELPAAWRDSDIAVAIKFVKSEK
ncbi:MAG TPA: hypothetical protein VLQ89_08450, partial [Candidatus Binatia bacterium]|nr:hypothetical protein [Candidatus Binatia bacterium]